MPYIARGLRTWLDPLLRPLCAAVAQAEAGTVNYIVTRILLTWLGDEPRYADYNAAIGVLECAKLELYREVISRYEDDAKVANGPIPHGGYRSEP